MHKSPQRVYEGNEHSYVPAKPLWCPSRSAYAFVRTAGMPVVARVLIGLEYAIGLKLLAEANKQKLNLTLQQLMVWSVCPYIFLRACVECASASAHICVQLCAHGCACMLSCGVVWCMKEGRCGGGARKVGWGFSG